MNQLSSPESLSLPKTARGRRTREKILSAAEHVFGELGYERASIVEITQRASVAQGSFYTYFPNKQAAFTELVLSLSDGLRAAVTEAVSGETSRLAAERQSLVAFFKFILEHKALYRIVRQAEFVDEALYRDYYRRIAQAYARG
ncbi:MAG: AcrR family transcriptional regulator, partial [Myxococcota bacterium]